MSGEATALKQGGDESLFPCPERHLLNVAADARISLEVALIRRGYSLRNSSSRARTYGYAVDDPEVDGLCLASFRGHRVGVTRTPPAGSEGVCLAFLKAAMSHLVPE